MPLTSSGKAGRALQPSQTVELIEQEKPMSDENTHEKEEKAQESQSRRGRPKRSDAEAQNCESPKKEEKVIPIPLDLEDMPLNSIEDYKAYNKMARKQRKPVKFVPHDLFPKQRVRFIRSDNQPSNPLKLRFRSGEYMIDFQKTLKPGEVYELPIPVIDYLNNLKEARYKQIKYPDGRAETVLDYHKHRFSCQAIYGR